MTTDSSPCRFFRHRQTQTLDFPSGVRYIQTDMENKFIILMMSCNKPAYLSEEEACRDTFLKDAAYAGVPYWFYRGGADNAYVDGGKVIHLKCDDSLSGTARKTLAAMRSVLTYKDWDYLVKTNVSTWLNIGRISETIEKLGGSDDENIYGAKYVINKHSKNIPFPRGHFSIFSRSTVEGIVKWGSKLVGADGMPKTDDTLIGLSCMYQLTKVSGLEYEKHIMEVPAVNWWPTDGMIEDAPELPTALCVRCKDERDVKNTPENMRRVHEVMHSAERWRTGRGYRPAEWFETPFGTTNFGTYMKVTSAIAAIISPDKNDTAQNLDK